MPGWLRHDEAVRFIDHRAATPAMIGSWPQWLPEALLQGLRASGIEQPWQHQRRAAELAWAGHHVAITTATASVKSLAYLLPILAATAFDLTPAGVRESESAGSSRLAHDRLGLASPTALYVAPTKALEHDQWQMAKKLGPPDWLIGTLDGDSDQAERNFARIHARFVLTNPDMLHRSLLPNHANWARLLRGLSFVVIDEAHRYSGVFGAQVAQVLRRLSRLCAQYGSHPVFLLASATALGAGESGACLIGESKPIEVVAQDTSPRCARDVVLWQPHDCVPHDAADLMARLVDAGQQVITFVASRTQAELIALRAQKQVTSGRAIASYRAGYLAADRRRLESDLKSGRLGGVAATNALELGIDISGMDAVLVAGYPGRSSALWQQVGRAGRGTNDALAVVLQREDPLDAYLFAHPELIFDAPVEATTLYPDNPYVLGPQLAAAAQEAPLTPGDERWFGPTMGGLCEQLVEAGLLRNRSQTSTHPPVRNRPAWYWTRPDRAADSINLRTIAGSPLDIVDVASGRVVGQVDQSAADRTVHPGAAYLHQGEQFLVDEYRPAENQALVHAERLTYYTQPKSLSTVVIRKVTQQRQFGDRAMVSLGDIELSNQVIGYLRRDEVTGQVWDETPLKLPVHQMLTKAMWWTVPDDLVTELNWTPARLASAAHGAEHAAIGLLPMFAPCDRWDIGGLSTLLHPDTQACTIFVYDGHPGGAGFAEHGYQVAEAWAEATLERLKYCTCQNGCPACVVSPKCGNANQMLDKHAATVLLDALLHH